MTFAVIDAKSAATAWTCSAAPENSVRIVAIYAGTGVISGSIVAIYATTAGTGAMVTATSAKAVTTDTDGRMDSSVKGGVTDAETSEHCW
ncbi:MAG: hypothetical protein ABJD11_06160 [Gemmatimonadota bacterium]